MGESCCSQGSCHDDSKTPTDNCSLLEGGHYQGAVSLVKIAPAMVQKCACLICLRPVAPKAELNAVVFVTDIARPRDWIPIWQFERRAAAPAHAPDSSVA